MAFKMSRGIFHYLLGDYPLLPLIFVFCFVPHSSSLPWHKTAKRRSHWDARLSSVSVVFMSVPRKTLSVIQALLYSFFFCPLIAGGCDGFLSCFSGWFVSSGRGSNDLVDVGEETQIYAQAHNCMLRCPTLI